MRSVYQRACSYAFKCCPPLSKDLVHTAFVRHFNKHGTNLFDRDIYIVLRWVKNAFYNEINRGKYMKDGVYYSKHFYTIDDTHDDDCLNTIILSSKAVPPDEELISKEFYKELFVRVDNYKCGNGSFKSVNPKTLRQFLELVDTGYQSSEICEEMGISHQTLHNYKKKIQKIIKEMNKEGMKSPFNGDKTKIQKKITRKTYEENDIYHEYKYLPEAGCDHNEFYETRYNGTDFILIREKL